MKRLISQQEDIAINHRNTNGATEDDLIKAINQHAHELSKNNVITPLFMKPRKAKCQGINHFELTVKFKTIDGCFCPVCGYVFPF